ncbi:putative sphingolipid transporter spinster 2 [Artemisia annua]|uniref:Putative sphingolipid transporter spinster 2 n=1 Tax=Artemisia annua TaxID=35608 RepID=A0A2U1PI45_ARTAN|nr:putative sphingolipid transporter spinster 2 [Artemisia annua]
MGATSSKVEEDKALQLCRERKKFVRRALDGRCSLAATHFTHIVFLTIIGNALRMLVEPEAQVVLKLMQVLCTWATTILLDFLELDCECGLSLQLVVGFQLIFDPSQFAECELFFNHALVGVGEASFISLDAPFIDDNAPAAHRTAWLGIFYMCIPTGISVGYVYGGLVYDRSTKIILATEPKQRMFTEVLKSLKNPLTISN